ncbi:hypothetical protein HZS_4498 [Henneguya salminicola]|nr:hypothetical protein HZS_4498 [Henneguya salminicola]
MLDFNHFYWSAVTSLAKSGLWSKIDSLYETKKNAFSLTSYCDIYIEQKAPIRELEKFIFKLPVDSQVSFYIKANSLDKAADLAIQSKNEKNINNVLSSCKIETHDSLITALKKQLNI